MKFVIQRVSEASVSVRGKTIASIEKGLLVLAGIRRGDTEKTVEWMVRKILNMRIFEDDGGKMNRSILDEKGSLLMVPNFTLYADPSKGNRPSFFQAEKPKKASLLYQKVIEIMKNQIDLSVQSGEFGADMKVSLINDGPVTIILERDSEN
jgi:D-tyrosyl-tRNA(Tyr) deacylase